MDALKNLGNQGQDKTNQTTNTATGQKDDYGDKGNYVFPFPSTLLPSLSFYNPMDKTVYHIPPNIEDIKSVRC